MLANLTLQNSLSLNSHPYTVNSTGDPNLPTLTIGTVYDAEYPISFQQLFLLNFGNSIPKGAIIQSAKIAVKMNSRTFTLGGAGHNFSIAFNALANDWDLSSTKWGNRPVSLAGNSFLVKNEDLNVVREYDVTDMLQVLINNGTEIVFQVTGGANFSNNAYAQYIGLIGHTDSPKLTVEYTTNKEPTVSITSPATNQTFHENSTLIMAGSTVDTDIDDVVTIKYQIDSGTVRNLHSAVSNGSKPIDFSKTLTLKNGNLYDGEELILKNINPHHDCVLSIWAEDDKGGISEKVTRTFRRGIKEIYFESKEPIQTDELAERFALKLEGYIPEGSLVEIHVCNNAFDENPSWENVTGYLLNKMNYMFMNKTKTHAKAGIKFKVRAVKPEGNTEVIYIDYVSGAFD